MKFKDSMLITILLLISAQYSAAFEEAPPAYEKSLQLGATQPSLFANQPSLVATQPQPVIIQRTITICPQCGCSANNVIRVLVCLGTPVILPVAFAAGAIHGCACGGLEVCGEVSKKANEEGDLASACCTCCCSPCICIAGTIAGIGETAIKYVTGVVGFIKNGN